MRTCLPKSRASRSQKQSLGWQKPPTSRASLLEQAPLARREAAK